MDQTGVLYRMLKKWSSSESQNKADCLNPSSSTGNQIDIKMVITAFIILGGSIIGSTFIFLSEKIFHRYYSKNLFNKLKN